MERTKSTAMCRGRDWSKDRSRYPDQSMMALQAGADVRTVAVLLGHASPSTTLNIYGHVVAGAQERAVNAIGDAFSRAQASVVGGENGRS